MDFIVGFSKVDGCGNIMVRVDRFSKYEVFILVTKKFTIEDEARLIFRRVVKYLGILTFIVRDRDTRFIKKFWTELLKMLGTELNFSTSFHPQ